MREDLYGSDLLDTVNHLLFLAGRVSQETVILEKCYNEAVGGRKHITFPGYSHQVKKWLVFQVTALRGQIFNIHFVVLEILAPLQRSLISNWFISRFQDISASLNEYVLGFRQVLTWSQRALILRMFRTSKIFGFYLRKTRKLRHFWQNLCARSKAINPTVEDLFHIMIGNWFMIQLLKHSFLSRC